MGWMRKFVSACLLTFLLLGLIGNFLPNVEASPDFVTETSTEITIENSYYKAIFDKDPANGYGRIRYFYIKPDTTNNIIPDNIWCMFAGHEILTANGTTEHDPRDWAGGNTENFTMTVEYNSGGTAIVSCDKWWKTYAEGYYQAHIVTYWAFYEDKPYYLETHKRVYNEDFSFIFNSEVCYFFNVTWVSTYKTLDEDGTILTDENPSESIGIKEASRLEKYPWVWYHNTTADLGIGMILLSADPPTTSLWAHYPTGGYIEAQIQYGIPAVQEGQTAYHTLLIYVTNDYSVVDSLAGNMVSATETTESFLTTVQINENKPTSGVARGDFGVVPNRVWIEPQDTTAFKSCWYYQGRGSNIYAKYENSTDTYALYDWSGFTWEDWSWNGSYGTVTLQNDFESKIRLRWKLEFWNNSDCVRHTLNFTTLTTCNISAFYLSYYENMVATNVQRLNASVIKLYDYDCYYEPWIEEVGIACQNMSGCTTNEVLSSYANFYALNQTEAEVPSGTSYEMEIKEQFYYRLKSEALGEFTASDILDYQQSENNRFNVLRWNKFPLHENRDFYIKHYGYSYLIDGGSYDGVDLLSFIIVGETGTASTIQIYLANKGEPLHVVGATSWSYDSTTKICTIIVSHASAEQIELNWIEGESVTRLREVYAIIYAAVPLLGLIAVTLIAGGVIYAFRQVREREWS